MSTQQVETATIVGTVTLGGDASVIVTAARMTNSPKTVSVAVELGDDASAVATKVKSALALDSDVGAFFAVSGTGADVVLTARLAAPNDTTLNIAYTNDTCTGLTPDATSADTTAGDGIENGYATLAELKAYIQVRGSSTSTDAGDDAVMETLIESASRKIDEITGRKFYKNSVDEVRYFETDDPYYCDATDIVSVTTLAVDYVQTRTYTNLASTDFELLPDNASLDGKPYSAVAIAPTSAAYFPSGRRGVKITGVFGWSAAPTNIKEDCLAISHNLWMSRSGQTSAGKVSITASGIVIRPEEIPSHVMDDLLKFRIYR